jgi:dipeptidyl aminopeptidase/acylaminoacyl peptidase
MAAALPPEAGNFIHRQQSLPQGSMGSKGAEQVMNAMGKLSSTKTALPCGTWPSTISARQCARHPDGMSLAAMQEPRSDGRAIYWLAVQAAEQGRNALMRWALDGEPQSVLSAPWDARSGVNEYGGAAYLLLNAPGTMVFSHYADGRLYRTGLDALPVPLTGEGPFRYADMVHDATRNRIICVRENHECVAVDGAQEATELVAIDLATGEATVLVSGADVVSSPRLSHDGSMIAWVAWDHPNMPWDHTSLYRARVGADGSLVGTECESSTQPQARTQPQWAVNGDLWFVSDADGWWNLYRWPQSTATAHPITRLQAEIGAPAWRFGQQHWAFVATGKIAALLTQDGRWFAATIDTGTGAVLDRSPAHALLNAVLAVGGKVFVVGVDERGAMGMYEYRRGVLELRQAADLGADTAPPVCDLPTARLLEIPLPVSTHTRPGEVCYAWFYAPANSRFEPLAGEAPPVIVQFHGGPTAASSCAFSMSRAFWTSRGFAVLDINYRGSSGWGRAYRHRLYGDYLILDVEDAVAALNHAASMGWVDRRRAIITGASSGGCTTLAALADTDVFALGINLFGVPDLSAFAVAPHKFESHFLKSLVGDWKSDPDLLRRRSPIDRVDRIQAPMMTLQGSIDKIVSPHQSHLIVEAVRAKGLPCAYIEFAGEGHGFRREETLVRTLEAMLSFCAQILGFEPADPVERVKIENLDAGRQLLGATATDLLAPPAAQA